jgi:hypothetical protein
MTGSATGLPNTYAVEIVAPDLSAYAAGNTGVPYVWTFDSGRSGPHVAVTALVHGNELCGAVALDWLFRMNLRPRHGKLSLVFVNVAAFDRFDPQTPDASRWVDEDFNRLWGEGVLADPVRPVTQEVVRARQLQPWLRTVDLLLDLHSMQHKTEPLTIAGPTEKGRRLADAMGWPSIVVSDHGHAEGVRMRDFGDFASPASPRNAVLARAPVQRADLALHQALGSRRSITPPMVARSKLMVAARLAWSMPGCWAMASSAANCTEVRSKPAACVCAWKTCVDCWCSRRIRCPAISILSIAALVSWPCAAARCGGRCLTICSMHTYHMQTSLLGRTATA